MLVYFHKGFVMEGEDTCTKRERFWKKPTTITRKHYCFSGVSGICDSSELEAEIERLTQEHLNASDWRIIPYSELPELAKEKGWDTKKLPKEDIYLEYVGSWKMNKILERLTGEQFAKFCKDYNIFYKGNEND